MTEYHQDGILDAQAGWNHERQLPEGLDHALQYQRFCEPNRLSKQSQRKPDLDRSAGQRSKLQGPGSQQAVAVPKTRAQRRVEGKCACWRDLHTSEANNQALQSSEQRASAEQPGQ